MKWLTMKILPALLTLALLPLQVEAGLWDVIQDTVVETVTDTVSEQTRNVINGSTDEIINGVKEDSEQNSSSDNATPSQSASNDSAQAATNTTKAQTAAPNINWDRYDFIPGDEIIFSDGPSRDEENGEFPSRWDMVSGNTEIVEFDGQNVIALTNAYATIVPYLKNSAQDYLPEVFTIEFDIYFLKKNSIAISVYLYDKKNQSSSDAVRIAIGDDKVNVEGQSNSLKIKSSDIPGWRHIAIAYTKGKLKVYMDATRLINIPRSRVNAQGLTISSSHYDSLYIKNVRIAKGGVKYYDRLLSDGKIVVNGIRFDTGQSDIKPESNGAISEIVKLMEKNSAVNLSIEGHTDSDGDTKANLTLSQARAKAVMARIIALGIDAKRLKSKGLGDSKPLDSNSSDEGKANNRRVEFVKF